MSKLPPLYLEYQSMVEHLDEIDDRGGGKVFLVGLGGGLLPQYIIANSNNLTVDAAEISKDVVSAARAFFGVAAAERSGRLSVRISDGLSALQRSPAASYEAVVVDCCDEGHVPEPCRSAGLVDAIHAALKPGGVVLQNVPVGGGHGADLDAAVHEYSRAFGEKAVSVEPKGGNAVIVVTSQ